uniref:ATP synthase subunit a n=1 Tax=Pedinomonas minor TaxID=3159 RepID=Q9ZY27_PEDMN|nr:ATP synthase F0 subunit 6 [Pedinomonas minor]AAD19667.1 ATP synthase F0 subunit 6 [Pedinomonas minor]
MNSALIIFCDYIFQFFIINFSTVSFILFVNFFVLLLMFSISFFIGSSVVRNFFQFLVSTVFNLLTSLLFTQAETFNNIKFVNVILCLFFTIFISNLVGLFPFSLAPTAQLVVPLFLALFVFFFLVDLTLYRDNFLSCTITNKGGSKTPFLIKVLFPETVVRISQPLSLSMRLFSNILAGHFLLTVIVATNRLLVLIDFYSLLVFGLVDLCLVLVIFLFELVVAFLQSYIFVILTITYLAVGVTKANY